MREKNERKGKIASRAPFPDVALPCRRGAGASIFRPAAGYTNFPVGRPSESRKSVTLSAGRHPMGTPLSSRETYVMAPEVLFIKGKFSLLRDSSEAVGIVQNSLATVEAGRR